MTRLLRVEVLRLVSRRAVLVLVLLAVAVPTVIGVARVLNTRPPSADDVASAQQQIAEQRESRWYRHSLAQCEAHPARHGVTGADDVQAACEQNMGLTIDNYLWYDKLSLADEREGSGTAVVTVLAILMMLVGATFAGHDWASGSMSNQLLFEPRRLRVWLAKTAVVLGLAVAVSAVVVTAYWVALDRVATGRDIAVRDGVLMDCFQMGWRGAAVAGAAAVGGFALTMLFRSTVGALGVLLAVGLAGGLILAAVGFAGEWNPGLNLLAVVLDGTTYWKDAACPGGGGGGCSVEVPLSLAHGLTYLSVLLAAAVAGSVTSFWRRDVP